MKNDLNLLKKVEKALILASPLTNYISNRNSNLSTLNINLNPWKSSMQFLINKSLRVSLKLNFIKSPHSMLYPTWIYHIECDSNFLFHSSHVSIEHASDTFMQQVQNIEKLLSKRIYRNLFLFQPLLFWST